MSKSRGNMIQLRIILAVFLVSAVSSFAQTASAAGAACLTLDVKKLEAKIGSMSSGYGDVAPCVNCQAQSDALTKLICRNDTLRLMENLASKAHVYADENATKSMVNHRKASCAWLKKQLGSCRDEECACKAFKTLASDDLGGESPY